MRNAPTFLDDNEINNPYNSEIRDILGKMPTWIVRWGITCIFFIFICVIIASWFIKFPDTIPAKVTVTTKIPPSSIIARADGRIKFYVSNDQLVNEGDTLAILENPAITKDITILAKKMEAFSASEFRLSNEIKFSEDWQLGELQTSYLAFLSVLTDNFLVERENTYFKQIESLEMRILHYKELGEHITLQNSTLSEKLELTGKELARNEMLFKEGVIAEATFEKVQVEFLETKHSYQLAQVQFLNNKIEISELVATLEELKLIKSTEQSQKENSIIQSFQQLESDLAAWRQKYIMTSPIDGTITLTKYWGDNQFIKINTEVITVVPESGALFGKVLMPMMGSGKVKPGQTVYLRFDNYPSDEYGTVYSTITSISAVPLNGEYIVDIDLPYGLVTSHGKILPFKQLMAGTAEIITDDLRLLERILFQFKKLSDLKI